MKFDVISRKIMIFFAVLWFILAILKALPLGWLYIYLGVLIAYVGIKNLIILNISSRNGEIAPKIQRSLANAKNDTAGLIFYVLFNILFFLVIGIIVIISGYLLL